MAREHAYSVRFTKAAASDLRRLSPDIAKRILAKLDDVRRDPRSHPATTQLRKRPGRRLRVGDWRVLYRVVDDAMEVLVVKVGHRRDVYDR